MGFLDRPTTNPFSGNRRHTRCLVSRFEDAFFSPPAITEPGRGIRFGTAAPRGRVCVRRSFPEASRPGFAAKRTRGSDSGSPPDLNRFVRAVIGRSPRGSWPVERGRGGYLRPKTFFVLPADPRTDVLLAARVTGPITTTTRHVGDVRHPFGGSRRKL